MRVLKLPKCKRVVHLSFSSCLGQLAAVTSAAGDHIGAVVWVDVVTGESRRHLRLDAQRWALAPGHARVAVADAAETRPRGRSPVRWAAVPADGSPDWVDLPGVPHGHVSALGFAPDGVRLVVGCFGRGASRHPWDHAVHIAPVGRGKAVTFPTGSYPGEVALSPDGRWLAVSGGAGGEPDVWFYQYPVPEPMASYRPDATRTRRLVFARAGPALVAAAGKRAAVLWAGRSAPVAVLEGHTAQVTDAAFTPDGRRVLTAGHDGTVRVWDAESGSEAGAFAWGVGRVTAVAVAPDGLTAAAAGEKGQVVIWDVER